MDDLDLLARQTARFDHRPLASSDRPLRLLFLHHSIGGQLLAEPGPDDGKGAVHPNGGGLRKRLEASGTPGAVAS